MDDPTDDPFGSQAGATNYAGQLTSESANPPQVLETPDQTEARVAQQQRQTQQVWQSVQAVKAKDLQTAAIPSYTDSGGTVQPVTDSTGAAVTDYDKKNNVGWDSAGNPVQVKQNVNAPPSVEDAFSDTSVTTDPKTGDQYKIRAGLPWQYQGQDSDIAAQNLQNEQDKAVSNAAGALGRKLTLDERQFHFESTAAAHQSKALASQFGLDGSEDLAGAQKKISDSFNNTVDGYGSPQANETQGYFGSGPLTPEAQAYRAGIDQKKAAALQQASDLNDTQQDLATRKATLDQQQAQRTALAQMQVDAANRKLAAAGVTVPGTETATDTGSGQTDNTVSRGTTDVPPVPSEVKAQAIQDAATGKKPYSITQDGALQLSDQQPLASIQQAVKDGLLPQPPPEVMAAAAQKQKLIDDAGSHPEIKAAIAGAGRGAAFLAGAPVGAGAGALIPGLGETGIGELAGGLVSGSLAAYGYGKLISELGKYNSTINSFVASQQLHPNYSAAGEFAAFGAGLPKALMKGAGGLISGAADTLAESSQVTGTTADAVRATIAQTQAAAKAAEAATGGTATVLKEATPDIYSRASDLVNAIGKAYSSSGGGLLSTIQNLSDLASTAAAQKGPGFAAAQVAKRVGISAAGMVAIDTTLKEGSKALGLSDEGQTWGGAAQAAVLGAFASGHGIAPKDYDSNAVGDIILRGMAHDVTGTDPSQTVDMNRLVSTPDIGSNVSARMTHPLTPEEQEIYSAFNQKASQLINEGKLPADPSQWQAKAKQILFAGRKGGVANVEITPKAPEAAPEPPTPPVAQQLATTEAQPSPVESAESLQAERAAIVRAGAGSPELKARIGAIDAKLANLGAPTTPAAPATTPASAPGTGAAASSAAGGASAQATGTGAVAPSGNAPTVDDAAHEAATSPVNPKPEPTPGQVEAGNYQMGHPNVGGLPITIEHPIGSKRFPDGPALTAHYGYVKGTQGADGDHIDAFVKGGTPTDYNGPVFVVNQNKRDGTFDESKAVIGANSPEEAKEIYDRQYKPGTARAGTIATFSTPAAFKEWAQAGQKTTPAVGDVDLNKVQPKEPNAATTTPKTGNQNARSATGGLEKEPSEAVHAGTDAGNTGAPVQDSPGLREGAGARAEPTGLVNNEEKGVTNANATTKSQEVTPRAKNDRPDTGGLEKEPSETVHAGTDADDQRPANKNESRVREGAGARIPGPRDDTDASDPKRIAAVKVATEIHSRSGANWEDKPIEGDTLAYINSETRLITYDLNRMWDEAFKVERLGGDGAANLRAVMREEDAHYRGIKASQAISPDAGAIQLRLWDEAPESLRQAMISDYGGLENFKNAYHAGIELEARMYEVANGRKFSEETNPRFAAEAAALRKEIEAWKPPEWVARHFERMRQVGASTEAAQPNIAPAAAPAQPPVTAPEAAAPPRGPPAAAGPLDDLVKRAKEIGGDMFGARPPDEAEQSPAAPFYAKLPQVIGAIPQETMTIAQAKAAIAKGARPDEIKMSGIVSDPLSPMHGKQPNDKVTRAALKDYAIERASKVQDVTLGEPKGISVKTAEDAIPHEVRGEKGWIIPGGTDFDLGRTPEEAAARWNDANKPTDTTSPTHFSQYQLPGAEPGTYREQFVTWPKPSLNDAYALAYRKIGVDKYKATAEQHAKADELATFGEQWNDGHSQYSSIQNPIVRLRRNIRTDADGNKTLFLEEMQGPKPENQEKMPPEIRKRIYEIGMKRAIREAAEEGATHLGWTLGKDQIDRYEEAIRQNIDRLEYEPFKNEDGEQRFEVAAHKNGKEVFTEDDVTPERLTALVGKDLAAKIQSGTGTSLAAERPLRPGWMAIEGKDLSIGGHGLKQLYDVTLPRIANEIAKKFGGKVGKSGIPTGGGYDTRGVDTPWIVEDRNGQRVPMQDPLDENEAERLARENGGRHYEDETVGHKIPDQAQIHSLELPAELKKKAIYEGFPVFGARPVIDETVYHSTAHPGNLEAEGVERTGASPGTVGIFTTPDAEAAKGWGGPEATVRKMRVRLFKPFDLRDIPLTKEFTKPELAAMLTSKGLNVTAADIPSQYGKMSFDEWKPEIESLTPKMRAAGFDGYVTNTESDGREFTEHVPFSPKSLSEPSEIGARPVYDAPIPKDRAQKFMALAADFAEKVDSPATFAAAWKNLGPKALQYSQSFWQLLRSFGAKGPAEPNWDSIYGAKEAPAAKPEAPAPKTPAEAPTPKRTFRRKVPEPAGGHDLIESVLSDIGKITHPETARRDALRQEGKTVFNRTIERGGQYDGWMNLPSQLRSMIFGKIGATGHSDPDEAAQVAYDHGLIREPTPDTLREALLSAWKTRLSLRAAERAQNIERKGEEATKQRQDADFAKDSKTPAAGAESIKADDMNVGDVVDVASQALRVIDVDPDTGQVTLEDHSKYGIQHIEEGHFIYGELEKAEPEGSGFDTGEEPEKPAAIPKLRPGEKGTSDLFQGSDAPFNLMGETGVDTMKQAQEKEAAAKRAEEAKKLQDRQQLDIFNPQSSVTPETKANDLSTGSSLEPDRQGAGPREPGGQGGVPAEPGAVGENGRSLDAGRGEIGSDAESGPLSADVPSAPYRSPGDQPVREPASAVSERPPRDVERGGGGRTNDGGLSPESPGPKDAHAPLVVPGESSAVAAGGGTGESGVGEYHPALTPEQKGDVQFIERRLESKPGVLITNGTGTGKTFSGLGAVHRALARGAEHILVVAPSDKIGSDWVAAAKEHFGIKDIKQLESTSENGSGNRIAVATYANLGQNDSLVRRPWQMLVADEAHYLSQAQEGNKTNALDNFRALTFHPQGHFARARMMEPEAVKRLAEIAEATSRNRSLGPTFEAEKRALSNKLDDARARSIKHASTLTDATKPKALMMSATPFAYHFSLDYGEGYLFDYPPENTKTVGRYNHPAPRSQFYMENFGYRMRTGKLTKPENAVATGILERRFAEKLMKDGSMSGRALVVPHDYSRDFILTENALGAKIDEVMDAINANRELAPLREHLDISDYLARRFLLESLKARDAIPRVQKHLAMGRKVVIFHDYKKGGGQNPLRVKFAPDATANVYSGGNKTVNLSQLYEQLRAAVPGFDDTVAALDKLESPLVAIGKAFPYAGIFNGDVSSKKRREVVNDFNTSGGKMNVILVQRASGKEGISLHDKDGKHQRVFMDLGIPGRPTDAIQSEGRIYRHGVKSNAVDEYLVTGTNFERWTFAQTIAQRASTAENLAMGERARSLLQSFASGFNAAALKEPSAEQGTGGKAMDSAREHGDPYSNAVALYYTNAKKTSRNKSAEGIDYFPTPEPVGFKMTEWGGIRPGEKVLEPSAGHGAIARFFPDATNRHAVEPSNELAGRLALNAPDTEIHNTRFEDFNTANKFNVVAMNPPFGTAGKTAMDHLEKAVQHLREGGRIVALIPRGASMDKRFEKWYEGDGAKGIHLRAEFLLPSVAFERAGTGVSARIVVLDKSNALKDQPAQNLQQQGTRDLSDAKDIKELFARLKDLSVPDRPTAPKVAAADQESASAPAPKNPATLPAQVSATIPKPTSESDYSPAEFLHTRDNVPVFVAKAERYMARDEFTANRTRATALGGHYSNFKGAGAVPGFHFKTAAARDKFISGSAEPQQLGARPVVHPAAVRLSERYPKMYKDEGAGKGEISRIPISDLDFGGQDLDEVSKLNDNPGKPIIVRELPDKYEILDGYGRSAGMKNAGRSNINAILVTKGDITDLASGRAGGDDSDWNGAVYEKYGLDPTIINPSFGARPVAAPKPEEDATAAARAAQPGRASNMTDRRAAAAATARQAMPIVEKMVEKVKAGTAAAVKAFTELKPVTSYRALKGDYLGAGSDSETGAKGLQINAYDARMMKAAMRRMVPNPVTDMALSRYNEADGDDATLRQQAAASKNNLAPLYKRAAELTPEEKKAAEIGDAFFKSTGAQLMRVEMLKEMLENYVTHMVDKSSIPQNQKGQTIARVMGDFATSRMKTSFDFAIKRVFKSIFDLEQAGYRLETTKMSDLMAIYSQSANNVIAARTFIAKLPTVTGEDGRPLATVSGSVRRLDPEEGEPHGPLLIKPFTKPVDAKDYLPIDHPALRKYKWLTKDADGKPVFVEGELLIHPEIYEDLSNTLGKSALNKFPAVRMISDLQHQVKSMMLGWSLFHYVQEGTHAIGHGVNPFKLHDMEAMLKDPVQGPKLTKLMNRGLLLFNWDARRDMAEGLGGHGGLLSKIPGLGALNDHLTSFLFEKYIPALKATMALHALDRNFDRPVFQKGIKDGTITEDQVYQKTATQSNEAFGGQNTRYRGDNPTTIHAQELGFLAPDFLKGRAKFFADAFTKYGGEQRRALIILAVAMAVTAKLLERMLTGKNDWSFKNIFSVRTENRKYELRSVPGDVIEFLTSPRWFISGRLSPLISRTALEAITGRDYRGMKRTPGEQLMDLLKEPIPMSVRGAIDKGAKAIDPSLPKSLRGKLTTNTSDITGGEQVASAAGARIKRASDITDARVLGHEWRQKQGLESDDTVYPPSKYVALKNALEDRDLARAKSEFDFLVKENAGTANAGALAKGFRESMSRPFSGAAKTEPAFIASLDKADRAVYDRAVASRNRVLSQFTQIAGAPRSPQPKPAMFEGFPE